MRRIQVLQPHIANQIAAGEVVERPASIVKELVENAMDAGATAIAVDIKNGGVDAIHVTDNGSGILGEDVLLAFQRHATSKISSEEDLKHIETMGFRGEALSSIAAVAQVDFKTCHQDGLTGIYMRMEGGECKLHQEMGLPKGTSILVENLFYNVPARRKFLKSARTEGGAIGDYMARLILARPDIAFRYTSGDKLVYQSHGDGSLKNALYCVFGGEVLPHLKETTLDNGYISVEGYIGMPEIARPNKNGQVFLLNRRLIRSYALSNAVQRAYNTRLMGGRFPFAVLAIKIASSEVDVNVHPAKLEVRFAQEGRVYAAIQDACGIALGPAAIPDMVLFKKPPIVPTTPVSIEPPAASSMPLPKDAAVPFVPFQENTPVSGIRVKESYYDIPHYKVDSFQIKLLSQKEVGAPSLAQVQEEQQAFGEEPVAIIGQVYNTFWIVQQGDALFFIDQHAAHERKLFEHMMHEEAADASQLLLAPELLQLSQKEYALLMEQEAVFTQLGFGFEPFGPSAIRVMEVPIALAGMKIAPALRDALELLKKQGRTATADIRREAIIQASCKHAIKGGDAITKEEIRELLLYFKEEGTPMTCPHGRPVMFRLTRKELEKMFRRIV